MGVNFLVAKKNDPDDVFFSDQSDHKFLPPYYEILDELADKLKVGKLTEFFDNSEAEYDFYEEIHGEEPPEDYEAWIEENHQWFEPDEALTSLEAIVGHLEKNGLDGVSPQDHQLLLDDLKDCLKMLRIVKEEKDLFSFVQYI